jgi:Lamin Tail Domain
VCKLLWARVRNPARVVARNGRRCLRVLAGSTESWRNIIRPQLRAFWSPTPAQAAPATVYIYKVYFDSPGSDRGSNSSLNAEYGVIKNGDDVSHSISGWTARDKAGHVYKFGNLRLGAGKQAIVHTGDGSSHTTSASTHLYWGREWYAWNNTGDKVILRRADGSLKDTCSYSGAGSKKYC